MTKPFFKLGEFHSSGKIIACDPAMKIENQEQVLNIKAGKYDVYCLAIIDTFMNEGTGIFGSILIKHESQKDINLESLKLVNEFGFDSCLAGFFNEDFFKKGLDTNTYEQLLSNTFEEMPNCPVGDLVKNAAHRWEKHFAINNNYALISNPENKLFTLFQDEKQVMIQCFEDSNENRFIDSFESMLKIKADYLRKIYVEREIQKLEQSKNTEFFNTTLSLMKNSLINHQNLTDEVTREIIQEELKKY